MPPWITSLLRDDTPLPMPLVASATMTSWPLQRRRARDRKPHHTGADDEDLHGCHEIRREKTAYRTTPSRPCQPGGANTERTKSR